MQTVVEAYFAVFWSLQV